jgi:effector-binding domain-containing protein
MTIDGLKIDREERDPQPIVGLHEVVAMTDLSDFFGRAFEAAAAELARLGEAPAGPPVALYRGPASETIDVVAGFPVRHVVTPTGGLVVEMLPGGSLVETIHTGSYDDLGRTYAGFSEWFAEQGLTVSSAMWEEYLVGPESETDPSRWQTRIVYPVA